MKKLLLSLLLVSLLFIGIRFYFDIYVHDEFGDISIFIKHRPIWKWKFYSPTGMSDLQITDLTEEKKEEQLLFNEFIRDQGLSR